MAIVRWDPFNLRWPSMFDWDSDDFFGAGNTSDNLDVYETEDEVVVRANVAGVVDDKVEVTFEKGILWIRAQEETEDQDGKKYYRKASRSYSYKIAVPGNIDLGREPEADIEKGVVTVTFKKAEEAKPKRIAVRRKK